MSSNYPPDQPPSGGYPPQPPSSPYSQYPPQGGYHPQSPGFYPPNPGGPPQKSGGGKTALYIVGGCLGLILIGVVLFFAASYFIYNKAKRVAKDAGVDSEMMKKKPGLASAKIAAALNPDIEIVSIDDQKNTVTLRDKRTGATTIWSQDDPNVTPAFTNNDRSSGSPGARARVSLAPLEETHNGQSCPPEWSRYIRQSEPFVRGRAVHQVMPEYPHLASNTLTQGEVVVAVLIGADGSVEGAQVQEGDPLLREGVEQAVRQWRFTPLSLRGQPVRVQSSLTLQFSIGK
jgi:TonB family protein